MGASDNIGQGLSTFMVELGETAHILKTATHRSLVILDELGRGTSTHDGMAIAFAALEYLLQQTKCLTLFVTHYPLIGTLANQYPHLVTNYHMAFIDNPAESEDDTPSITFLYRLVQGLCANSYGLNVARLADLPPSLIQTAAIKSQQLKQQIEERHHSAKKAQSLQMQEWCQELLRAADTGSIRSLHSQVANALSSISF
eukprot:TRINITY_DN8137_c0_g1_i2.p1 TRINITY_DN8137_c0_g1~~TRINITY_DN8137_c0_g1_i2.p1  ORF type:complete len:200 (-),score=39.97 TRINITY_DN8137_c0_g1_i2:119-718(-)